MSLRIPAAADMHSHLRQGDMMRTVVPAIRQGGCNLVYVMPNTIPPTIDADSALEYQHKLQELDPSVTFLMSLYLSRETTPETVRTARKAGIYGIKYYPKGVTTNSESGVDEIEQHFPVLAEMEKCGLVLNLHGEAAPAPGVTVLNAEHTFLPVLHTIHERFPRLKIVLEHCTTEAAIKAVRACGDTVVGTITAHHLFITVDSWCGTPLNFCKPVAKLPQDRDALLAAATSGDPKFFLGTDSAPHPISAKSNAAKTAAGCFTQPYALPLVAKAFESQNSLGKLKDFCSNFGRDFYGIPRETREFIELVKNDKATIVSTWKPEKINKSNSSSSSSSNEAVIPFMASEPVGWTVKWVD